MGIAVCCCRCVGGVEVVPMTKAQIANSTGPLSVSDALRLAFDAGYSYAVGDHTDFVQLHEPAPVVLAALERRVKK